MLFRSDPNAYGGFLLTALILRQGLPGKKTLLVDITLLVGILLTFSRSSWIGLGMALILLLVFKPRQGATLLALAVLAIALGLLIMGWQSALDMAARPNQIHARLDIANAAVKEFADNPIWGMGLGAYSDKYGQVVHNTPLWVLAEFGLLGLAVFISFMGWFISVSLKLLRSPDPNKQQTVAVVFIAFVATLGLSMGIEAFYQRYWWFVMSIISAARVLPDSQVV